jgi:hypothetical protein
MTKRAQIKARERARWMRRMDKIQTIRNAMADFDNGEMSTRMLYRHLRRALARKT